MYECVFWIGEPSGSVTVPGYHAGSFVPIRYEKGVPTVLISGFFHFCRRRYGQRVFSPKGLCRAGARAGPTVKALPAFPIAAVFFRQVRDSKNTCC